MRLRLTAFILAVATPVYAQGLNTSSGAMSLVNISDPPASASTTTHLVTPPTTVAPGLAAAGIETCLGSASGGLSLMGGGFTFGSTKVDEGCTIRLLARQLFAFGFKTAALALMCQDGRVAMAMETAGTPCPDPTPEPPVPVEPRQHAAAFVPALSFAPQEKPTPLTKVAQAQPPAAETHTRTQVPQEPPAPLFTVEQTTTLATEPQVKPFTLEEDALFKRLSNIE
jgi:hypothetical protein